MECDRAHLSPICVIFGKRQSLRLSELLFVIYRYSISKLLIFNILQGNESCQDQPHPPRLPIAYIVLRILIVLNWLAGAAILALLVAMPNQAMDHERVRSVSFA